MQRNTLNALVKETEFIDETIKAAKGKMSATKEALDAITLEISSLSLLKNDSLVRTAATAHSNIEHTKRLLLEVRQFSAKYKKLRKEMKSSTENPSAEGLLSIYKEIKEVLGLKNAAPEITEKIGILEKQFEILVLTLVDSLPEIVQKEGAVAYLKIVKVSSSEAAHTEGISKQKRKAKIPSNLECNLSRNRLFEVFLDSLDRKFAENLPGAPESAKARGLAFVLQDLSSLKKTESLPVSAKYQIFAFACIQYHRLLYEYLDKNSNAFDPEESIGILLWSKNYYAEMLKMGKMKSLLGPVLFSGREEEVANKYVKAAEEKLTEWIGNLAAAESTRFRERKKAPDLDSEGKFISIGFMDLLHIIRQQLEPIYTHPEIFRRLSQHILKCVRKFKETLSVAVLEELDLLLKDKAQNGFEEYCIALSNSGLKFMDCLHTLSFYSDSHVQAISEVFHECMVCASDALVQNILFVISPAVRNMYTRAWNSEPVTQSIVSTYADYLKDYRESMIDYAFTFFVSSLLGNTVEMYFERCTRKKALFLGEHLCIVGADRKRYRELFGQHLSKNSLKSILRKLDCFIAITSSDNVSICAAEVALYVKEYPEDS
ncbi:exocyst complex component 3, partial [Nematocida major]|uniref:exocyst complex component 3 n=1 Tax=Nematocida major TaxID=1912982 RepID=UPI002007B95F